MNRRFLTILMVLLGGLSQAVQAQVSPPTPFISTTDSTSDGPDTLLFTNTAFLAKVLRSHPMAVQATLQPASAEAGLRKARGGFDPKIESYFSRKELNEKDYWTISENNLKIPLPFGPDIKGGWDNNSGQFLNPERSVPGSSGLAYAGLSVPVLQGLLMDKRRTDLRKAKLMQDASQAARRGMLNDLLLDANMAYWYWSLTWQEVLIYRDAEQLATTRFQAVRRRFILGDYAAIDTLEALINLQNRIYQRAQAEVEFRNSTLYLATYIWSTAQTPEQVPTGSLPEGPTSEPSLIRTDSLESLTRALIDQHPDLQAYFYKNRSLLIEQRWKKEKLKPKLNVEYNFLSEPVNFNGGSDPILSTNNYKWGFTFSFPILLREARGDLEMNRIKVRENQLKWDQKKIEMENKLRSYYNDLNTLEQQIALMQDYVRNYTRLLRGEERKFFNGESSLFKVNSRESKLLEARLKLNEIQVKFEQTTAKLNWASAAAVQGL